MDVLYLSQNPILDRNFTKLLQTFEQVDILTENGEIVKFPLLLLCLHSELIASIVSQISRSESFNISIPLSVEDLSNILETLIKEETNTEAVSALTEDMLGITENPTCDLKLPEESTPHLAVTNFLNDGVKAEIIDNADAQFPLKTDEDKVRNKTNENNLVEDISYESNAKFTCSICERSVHSKRWLKHHIETFHSNTKSYSCQKCKFATSDERNLKIHDETVHMNIRYECDQCGLQLTQKGALLIHKMSVHTTERPFICEVCCDSFKAKKTLRNHMETVHSTKIFSCEDCGKTFSHPDHLKVHQRYHNPDMQLKCDVCGRGFVSGQKLRDHMNTHTGEKPYKCKGDSCLAEFGSSSAFSHHKKSCLILNKC